jgi:hypothetical protein
MSGCAVKTMSAVFPASSMPGPEEPAWANAGRPCGERGSVSAPLTSKNRPKVDRPDQVGVCPDTLFLVGDDRVGIPAVPQPRDDLDELLGPRVAIRGVGMCREPEVAGRPGVPGGHDVPAGPAAGQVVDGGQPAR